MPNQILHKTCLKAGESTGIHQYIKHGGLTNVLFWGVMFLFSGETTTFFTYILGISMYMYVTYYYFFHESISSSLVCRRLNISSCLWVEGRKTCVFFLHLFHVQPLLQKTNQPTNHHLEIINGIKLPWYASQASTPKAQTSAYENLVRLNPRSNWIVLPIKATNNKSIKPSDETTD